MRKTESSELSLTMRLPEDLVQPEDLKTLINELHMIGTGVFLDWTPAHFPCHEEGLENFDGTPLYENPDPSMGNPSNVGHLSLQL